MTIFQKIKDFFALPPEPKQPEILKELNNIYENIPNKIFIKLDVLANEIRLADSGEKNLSLIDCKELLAILGERWRNQKPEIFIQEVLAIYNRAGKNRQNN